MATGKERGKEKVLVKGRRRKGVAKLLPHGRLYSHETPADQESIKLNPRNASPASQVP
ncbi:MAG: hypothetical protein JWO30_58 [Fibrobacteres bacterium]|nr:hypothetical protein [Fibrobacterota bacterium]